MGALGRSAGRVLEAGAEGLGMPDERRGASRWVGAVNVGDGVVRGEAYSRKIPTEAGWLRRIAQFLGGCFLLSPSTRYR